MSGGLAGFTQRVKLAPMRPSKLRPDKAPSSWTAAPSAAVSRNLSIENERFYKRQGDSCEQGRTLLCPDPSARGLARSKARARLAMTFVNAKRLELRWLSTAFSKGVSSQHLSGNKSAV
jgi:hypothetical protein